VTKQLPLGIPRAIGPKYDPQTRDEIEQLLGVDAGFLAAALQRAAAVAARSGEVQRYSELVVAEARARGSLRERAGNLSQRDAPLGG
jgi:hypothetical protein